MIEAATSFLAFVSRITSIFQIPSISIPAGNKPEISNEVGTPPTSFISGNDIILKFKSLGHKVSHLPLLNIEKMNYEKINFSDYGGIIFTSANAVKYLDLNKLDKNIVCFCVGEITEKKAK